MCIETVILNVYNIVLTQTVLEGGSDLVDELSLTTYCPLGENVITRGYQLPAHSELSLYDSLVV